MVSLSPPIPFSANFPELVQTAERAGYLEAWSYESFTTEAFSPLCAASMITTKLRFGTAIVPVFSRPPAHCDVRAYRAYADRRPFCPGLGISTPNIMQHWMGVPFRKPVTQMRETVEAIRAIFRREK